MGQRYSGILWRITVHCETCLPKHGMVVRYMIESFAGNSPSLNLSHMEERNQNY